MTYRFTNDGQFALFTICHEKMNIFQPCQGDVFISRLETTTISLGIHKGDSRVFQCYVTKWCTFWENDPYACDLILGNKYDNIFYKRTRFLFRIRLSYEIMYTYIKKYIIKTKR